MTEEMVSTGWFLIIFADIDREGDQFLGGCFVQANTTDEAIEEADRQGCALDGDRMMMGPSPIGPPPGYENRLLTREEIQEANAK